MNSKENWTCFEKRYYNVPPQNHIRNILVYCKYTTAYYRNGDILLCCFSQSVFWTRSTWIYPLKSKGQSFSFLSDPRYRIIKFCTYILQCIRTHTYVCICIYSSRPMGVRKTKCYRGGLLLPDPYIMITHGRFAVIGSGLCAEQTAPALTPALVVFCVYRTLRGPEVHTFRTVCIRYHCAASRRDNARNRTLSRVCVRNLTECGVYTYTTKWLCLNATCSSYVYYYVWYTPFLTRTSCFSVLQFTSARSRRAPSVRSTDRRLAATTSGCRTASRTALAVRAVDECCSAVVAARRPAAVVAAAAAI